jgi:hypothetical protein
MARKPQPGSDQGTWGGILNEFLDVAHNIDGSLKAGSVTTATVTDGAITEAKLDTALKDKVNAVNSGGATNLSVTTAASTVTVASDTGSDATLPAATSSAAGVLTAADKTKLDNFDTSNFATDQDLLDEVSRAETAEGALDDRVTTTVARVYYNTGTSSYSSRPAGFTSVEWVGPVAPAIGSGAARDGYDTWINTA